MHISIDVGQIESYGLSEPAARLLLAIARWEVRSLIDHGLRLRTACEFEPLGDDDAAGLGSTEELTREIRDLIDGELPELDDQSEHPLVVRWSDKKRKKS